MARPNSDVGKLKTANNEVLLADIPQVRALTFTKVLYSIVYNLYLPSSLHVSRTQSRSCYTYSFCMAPVRRPYGQVDYIALRTIR